MIKDLTTVSPHIFLVEDDAALSKALRKKLERKNYTVTVFDNGVEVFQAVKSEKPDLVLLDIQLPLVDGLEVLENLRKDEETKDVPVIMLTNLNHTSPKILKTTNAYPPQLYLVKSSWTLSALLDQIKNTLEKDTNNA